MGAYPQGNRKTWHRHLWKQGLCYWDFYFYRERYGRRNRVPLPDRYKSRYRVRRRFKRMTLAELLDEQRARYMRTIEEVLGEER